MKDMDSTMLAAVAETAGRMEEEIPEGPISVRCGSCVNQCPKKCLKLVPGYTNPGAEKKEEEFKLPEKKPAVKPDENAAVKAAALRKQLR